ncbi:DUF4430 domain-containing protein [Neobacillus niacini]|uniref:DUF4430 domain-containing protein n=1 Tax=Neobacillus niacini TaxID=86668 RepID=UPI0021CB11DB|nr:DUF4430 domain-containing protein [Neobacillus niacini]MCM3764311.1 DUF4430 domain-containing protein [Neobacillus niacini]
MRNKNLWLVMLLVFSIIASGFQTPVHAASETKQATITVIGTDPENPLVPETTVSYSENITATELLIQVVGGDKVNSHSGYISGINGLEAEQTYFWNFSVNGISSGVGAGSYLVQNGDKIFFRYTDWTKPIESSVTLKVLDLEDKNIIEPAGFAEFFGTPNAFQLLQAILGPDQVGFEETKWGKMIQTLQGVNADPAKNYWAFFVNGVAADTGAEGYTLKAGDEISFRLTSLTAAPGDSDKEEANPPAATFPKKELETALDQVSQYVLNSTVGEWEVLGLKQAGKTIPAGYLDSVRSVVKDKQGQFRLITDTERYSIGIVAAGGDPTNIEGYNLVEKIYNGDVTKQGINGVLYALIALDSGNFEVPETALWTREKLMNYILEQQNDDGGWGWSKVSSDIDYTAMALSALAPYKEQAGVKEKILKAVQYLELQYQNSKFNSSNTAAQVVVALSGLGLDANGSAFTKDESSLLQYLLSFQNSDGGFAFNKIGGPSNQMATTQSLQALAAYQLFSQGKGSLYNLISTEQNPGSEQNPGTEQPKPETPTTTEQPKSEVPTTEQPKVDQQTDQTTSKENKTASNKLPNTATNIYNLLAIGILLMLLGTLYYLKQKKSKA